MNIYSDQRWEAEKKKKKNSNLLGYCNSRGVHMPESVDDYTVLHELCHLLHGSSSYINTNDTGVNPELNGKIKQIYEKRIKNPDNAFITSYSMSNHVEFFAENASVFFKSSIKIKRNRS